jgi:putative ABC transport system ATP-binding protein
MFLSLSHVSKVYGTLRALDDFCLDVPEGEWLSIVGSSGSGKTTAMNIIGCMDSPSEGKVLLEGRDLAALDASQLTTVRTNVIGLVFQQFHLVPHLTALENVMVAQYYHSKTDKNEALAALADVGLAERAHHLPSQLSGGEQQRVCIARALINRPRLVLADEPTGNLDEANEQLALDLFRKMHAEGTTLIVVTHDAYVASCGQRQILLDHGRLVSDQINEPGAIRPREAAAASQPGQGSDLSAGAR